MSLSIDASAIKNNGFCFRPNNESDPFTGKLTVPTFALGFQMAMSLGVPAITEDNVENVWERLHVWQRIMGSIGDTLLTYEDVQRHVGLRVNTNTLSDTKFKNRVYELLADESRAMVPETVEEEVKPEKATAKK
jgi:hypothetical protein